jgi:hypothetical protein
MHFPQLQTTIVVPVIAALLVSAPGAQAMPAAVSSMVSNVRTSIEARGFNGMGPVMLYLAVKDYLKDRNAYVSFISSSSRNYSYSSRMKE